MVTSEHPEPSQAPCALLARQVTAHPRHDVGWQPGPTAWRFLMLE